MGDSNDTVNAAKQLGLLLAQLPAEAVWPKVEETAQTLANSLRVRNGADLIKWHTYVVKDLLLTSQSVQRTT